MYLSYMLYVIILSVEVPHYVCYKNQHNISEGLDRSWHLLEEGSIVFTQIKVMVAI